MELTAQKREIFGKKSKSLKMAGLIAAELYGHNVKNLHLQVPAKDFSKVFKQTGESTILKLKIQGENKDFNVLIYDIYRNPLTDEVSHIDFYNVAMDEKIRTKVPLEFIGEAPAVKEQGGVLVKAMHEIEIESLPADLPHHIQVDISVIKAIGDSVAVKDLDIGKGVKFFIEPATVIATVTEMAKEEETAPAISVEDVKVESEIKKQEREKEKEKES